MARHLRRMRDASTLARRRAILCSTLLLLLVSCAQAEQGEPGAATGNGQTAAADNGATAPDDGEPAAGAGDPQTVIAGIGTDPGVFAQWVIARDKGFAEQHGIDLEVRVFEQGGVALDAMLAGEVDLGGPGQATVIPAGAQGEGVIIAAIGRCENCFGAVSSEEIQTPQDLQETGATIGRPEGTSPYFLARFLEHYELDESQLTITNVDAPSLVSALARGDIDAFFAFEPHVSTAVNELEGVRVLELGGDNDLLVQFTPLIVSDELYENRDLAKSVLAMVIDAAAWLSDPSNQEEAAQLLADALGVSVENAEFGLNLNEYDVWFSQTELDEFEMIAQFMQEQEMIDDVPDWGSFIDVSLLEEVDPDRVTVD